MANFDYNNLKSYSSGFKNPFAKTSSYPQSSRSNPTQPIYNTTATTKKPSSSSSGSTKKTSGSTKKTSGSSKPDTSAADKAYKEMMNLRDKQYSTQDQAFAQLLTSLDPQYENYRANMKKELDANQASELQQLQSRQMAYGTADSEQRDQAQERMSSGYADKFSQFLNTLSQQQAGQKATIGTQRASALNDIMNGKATDAYNMMLNQQQQQQQAWSNSLAEQQMARSGANSAAGKQNQIGSFINAQATDWLTGQAGNPYGKPGGREAIAQKAANQFGGTIADYLGYLPNGWESMYSSAPTNDYMNSTYGVFDKNTGKYVDSFGNENKKGNPPFPGAVWDEATQQWGSYQ